jgi:hypothetical protein
MEQAYVLGVNVCLTSSEVGADLRVGIECLYHNE